VKKNKQWKFNTAIDAICPICKEREKCFEQSNDYKLNTQLIVLRCRYCRHDFEELQSTEKSKTSIN
jgi:hypothetical protein